jgi:hypothetical protein
MGIQRRVMAETGRVDDLEFEQDLAVSSAFGSNVLGTTNCMIKIA